MNVRHSVVAVSLCLAMAVVGDSRAASAADDLVLALDRADAAAVSKALRSGLSASAPLAYPGEPTIKRTAIQWLLGFDASDDPPEQVEARRLAVLKMLFAKGAKLTGHQDEMFATIVQGHEKILRLLLDKGASPSERIYGYTPVELAYREGKLALVELLVARGGHGCSSFSGFGECCSGYGATTPRTDAPHRQTADSRRYAHQASCPLAFRG